MVSGWCLNDQNVSKKFIGGAERIFHRYPTFVRTIFGEYQ